MAAQVSSVSRPLRKALIGGLMSVSLFFSVAGTGWAEPNNHRFTVVSHDGTTRSVASGTINAVGTASFQSDVQFPVAGQSFSGTSTQTYPEGSLNFTFQGVFDSVSFNPAACIVIDTATGTFQVTGGSGAYQGASGSGSFSETDIVVLQRTAEGCGAPIHFTAIVHNTGQLSVTSS